MTHNPDAVHAEIRRLKEEIERKESILTGLEAEIIDLNRQLLEFKERYDRLIVPMTQRIEMAKEAFEELKRQRYLERRIGEARPLESQWKPPEGYVSVEEQYKRTWSNKRPPDTTAFSFPADILKPSVKEEEIKSLYRQLARRFHPDLTTDPAEREHRNQIMAQLNQAYKNGDVGTLQAIARQPDHVSAEQPLATLHLRELRQIHDQLLERIGALQRERSALMRSDLLQLSIEEKLARMRNRDLLREMSVQMEKEYIEIMLQIDELRRA